MNFSSLKPLKRRSCAPRSSTEGLEHLPDLNSNKMTNPQEALYLPVMRALSMFPSGTEVLDKLSPHPIIVFAAHSPEAEQVCGMVGC